MNIFQKTENFKKRSMTSAYNSSRFTINNYGDCGRGDLQLVPHRRQYPTSAIRQPRCSLLNCFFSLRSYPTENTVSVTKTNYDVRFQTYVALHGKSLVSFFFRFYQNWNVSKMFEKVQNTQFPEISFGGSQAVTW